MITTWSLLWLLAQAAPAPAAAETGAPPAAAPTQPASVPPPAASLRPPPPPPARTAPPPRAAPPMPTPITPFRLSLTYVHILREDGDRSLANPNANTNAVGVDMAFPSNTYVRNHLGLAHQWENVGGVTARGFRIDLISLGYPIPLVTSTVHLDLEPVLTILRGELMFVSNGPRLLRVESGFGLELSVTVRRWFLTAQVFGIDFRYGVWSSAVSHTGFARVFPLRVALGHEFWPPRARPASGTFRPKRCPCDHEAADRPRVDRPDAGLLYHPRR